MSKKGMEMSINLVVGLILGIAMLAAGILLFSKIIDNSNKTQDQLDEQTKKMIEDALDTGEPIYVPSSNVEVKKHSAIFWVGIRNIGAEEGRFMVYVTPVPAVPDGFDQSHIAFLSYYIIGAKEKQIANVAVDMKGITQKVVLKVEVKLINEETNEEVLYSKPKLVTIQP